MGADARARRVLLAAEPGGALCVAIVHPLNRPVEFLGDYFSERRISEVVSRRGLEMRFEGIDRPLESYTRALSAAGLLIEELREPRAGSSAVARAPELGPAAMKPFFLHMRCRLDQEGSTPLPRNRPGKAGARCPQTNARGTSVLTTRGTSFRANPGFLARRGSPRESAVDYDRR